MLLVNKSVFWNNSYRNVTCILKISDRNARFLTLAVNTRRLEGQFVQQNLKSTADRTKMNAPTTLPIEVETSRQSGVSGTRHYLNMGKSILKLYKTGIVNVWRNYKTTKLLREKYNITSLKALTQYVLDSSFSQFMKEEKNDGSGNVLLMIPSENHFSRADYQLLLRTSRDLKKLPLFVIIFAVFFETSPLLILLFPKISPGTCVLPYHSKKELKDVNMAIRELKQISGSNEEKDLFRSVHGLSDAELRLLARALFRTSFIPTNWLPRWTLKNQLLNYVDQIRADDILISRFGSVWALDDQELVLACLNRAISVEGKSNNQLRADLFLFITNFHQAKYDSGFFFHDIRTSEACSTELLANAMVE